MQDVACRTQDGARVDATVRGMQASLGLGFARLAACTHTRGRGVEGGDDDGWRRAFYTPRGAQHVPVLLRGVLSWHLGGARAARRDEVKSVAGKCLMTPVETRDDLEATFARVVTPPRRAGHGTESKKC